MKPLTYPLRPVQGGPFDKARAKPPGTWYYEPKYNGWRALVHVPTGTMFNRQGQQLSIAKEFDAVLSKLAAAAQFKWLDCEALDRRHGLGRGSLVVLDEPGSPLPYEERMLRLTSLVGDVGASLLGLGLTSILTNAVLLAPVLVTQQLAANAWVSLKAINAQLGCEFYEGLVAKESRSPYPVQLRSPNEEFSGWVKHRWQW